MSNETHASNGNASPTVPILSTSDSLQHYFDKRLANVQQQLPRLAKELRDVGIVCVEVHYDGVGDSGQIESIDFFDKARAVPFPDAHVSLTMGQITDLFYDLLQARHSGWEDGDGAFGDFRWDVVSDELTHEHHERFTDYQTTEHKGL